MIFARSHILPDGLRVRVRLARPGDQRRLVELLGRLGYEPSEPRLLELVRFDSDRSVICATALVDRSERIIGFGAIDLRAADRSATVIVEPRNAAAVSRLLRRALAARQHARALAAA